MTVISVENLIKAYGSVKAVDGITFDVKRGEVFGMLGPNGAGKTTTVEIIEGLRTPDSGEITVLGISGNKPNDEIKQMIGIQLQAPSLMPLLNVEEILAMFSSFYRKTITIERATELVGLTESRKVLSKNLSGGQQQRLSVAIALINDPEIAFLDEPTTGLDPQARRSLWTVIQDMRSKGKTVFLTTHYMEEAEVLCDRIAIIDHGKIIAIDSPQNLINTYFKESAIEFETDLPVEQDLLIAFPGATQIVIEGTEIRLFSNNIPATMTALLSKYHGDALKHLHLRRATLEDVFLKLTGRNIRE